MTRTRTRLAAALIPLFLVTAACGGGEEGGDRARTIDAPPSAAPAEPEGDGDKTLSQAQLQAALLTVQDLPTGYTLDTAASDEDEDEDEDLNPASDDCAARFEALDESNVEPAAEAAVDFEGGFGVVLQQELSSYEDEKDLSEAFEEFATLASDCPSFKDTDADTGETTEFTLGSLSFPKLGDDTLAFAVSIKTPDFEGKLNLVIVQLGRNIMYIGQGGLSADAAVLEQAARTGLQKLAAATE
jgi:hypothetical protein